MHGTHLINQIRNPGVLDGDNTLFIVGVCSNTVRFNSRLRLARDTIKRLAHTKNVYLTIVEAAFGARPHELTDDCKNDNIDIIHLRTNQHIWNKESMMNVGLNRVMAKFPQAKYFCCVDLDVEFINTNWAQETIQQLQHFEVVQPWSDSIDMGPMNNTLQHCRSFGRQHQHRVGKHPHTNKQKEEYYEYAHCGYAWAYTRKFLEAVRGSGGCNGPLIDFAILGSGDFHMCWSIIGMGHLTGIKQYKPSYARRVLDWQRAAFRVSHGEVGYVHGTILHYFHGPKGRRYYNQRYKILVDNGFDPDKHLTYDEQGLVTLVGNEKLDYDIYKYSLSRHEDSIEET